MEEVVLDFLLEEVIVPLFKRNSKLKAKNYRPLSLVNVITKILQRILYDRVEFFLTEKTGYG
jgi:hypothetical protein